MIFFEKCHLMDCTSFSMGAYPPGGSLFEKRHIFCFTNLLKQKKRATKFDAESTSCHAEINFLGLFREKTILKMYFLYKPILTLVESCFDKLDQEFSRC